MNNFCPHCGEKLNGTEDVCVKCGKFINDGTTKKVKVPGKGLSTAGMVLGIISAVWTLLALISIFNVKEALFELLENYLEILSPPPLLLVSFSIGYTLFSLIPSLIGLPLSIAGVIKLKSGKGVAGIILNAVALIASIAMIVYIINLGSSFIIYS